MLTSVPAAANSADFAKLHKEEVREDERYLHQFFQQKKPKKSKRDAVNDVLTDKEPGEWIERTVQHICLAVGAAGRFCVAAALAAQRLHCCRLQSTLCYEPPYMEGSQIRAKAPLG